VTYVMYYPGICFERLNETMKAITEDSWHPVRNSNLTPPEYKYKPGRSARMFPYCVLLNTRKRKYIAIYGLQYPPCHLDSLTDWSLEFALYPRDQSEVDKCETDRGYKITKMFGYVLQVWAHLLALDMSLILTLL
jgi:hypothetical protein